MFTLMGSAKLSWRGWGVIVATPLLVAGICCSRAGHSSGDALTLHSNGRSPSVILNAYPAFDLGDLNADELHKAMGRLQPPHDVSSVPALAHYLLLPQLEESSPTHERKCLSVQQILERVLDHKVYESAYPEQSPLLVTTRYGAKFVERTSFASERQRMASEAHVGQLLCALAEFGLSAGHGIRSAAGASTLEAVIADAMANFSVEQELDWTVPAFAIYLSPETEWQNKFGERFDFSEMVAKFTARRLGEDSSCGGTHTMYALAVLLQADEQTTILTPKARRSAVDYLRHAGRQLRSSQRGDGAWDDQWAGQPSVLPRPGYDLLVTGHHLDWMAIVPTELRVCDSELLKAVRFVVGKVEAANPHDVAQDLCPHVHGIRAARRLIRQVDVRLRENSWQLSDTEHSPL